MMKLYYSETLSPRKACAVAKYLEMPVEFVHVDLGKGQNRAPEYLALNPNAKVPTLVDGERVIWEANAIMCYLADKAGGDLWPARDRQVDIVRWLSWSSEHFTRHGGTLYFEYIIKPLFGMGEPDAESVDEATKWFKRNAQVLEAHLEERQWLLDDTLTVADFAVGIVLPYATEAHIPLDEFPQIRRWHAQLEAIEAWRDPFPARS